MAVAVLLRVIAVVEAENIAWDLSVFSDIFFGVFGDRGHPRDQPFLGSGFPVAGDQRPHYGLHVQAVGGRDYPGVAEAVGWAKPFGGDASGFGDGVVGALQVIFDLRRRALKEVRVGVGVIA